MRYTDEKHMPWEYGNAIVLEAVLLIFEVQ